MAMPLPRHDGAMRVPLYGSWQATRALLPHHIKSQEMNRNVRALYKLTLIISELIRLLGSLDYSIESMWFSMMDRFDFDPCAIYLLRVNKQQYVVFRKKKVAS